jgi:Lon protease-like protein
MNELGTLVEIIEVSKKYDNGEIDIKTRGQKIFRMLEIIKEVPDKLYSGAIVNYPENIERGNRLLMQKIINTINELHKLLKVSNKFNKPEDLLWSYDVAHHIGLNLDEEYEILSLMNELHRQEYLKRHLAKVLPVVSEMETLKEKIKMNGHFKNLEGLNLNL